MAVTPASLIANHPEFTGAPTAMVSGAISKATNSVEESMFKETYDEAVELLACHKLALSPYGQQARMVSADGATTTYSVQFDQLARVASTGFRVIM